MFSSSGPSTLTSPLLAILSDVVVHVDDCNVWSSAFSHVARQKTECSCLRGLSHSQSLPQTPFDHIWAMVWSGTRGNIAI